MAKTKSNETEFNPLDMLKTFKTAIKAKRISFVDKNDNKILNPLKQLIKKFQNAIDDKEEEDKRLKDNTRISAGKKRKLRIELKKKGLSGYLDSYEVHKEGQKLWQELMSVALEDIDRHPKGNSGLFKYVDAATKFEDMLYGLESYYRDHTLHSLWVFLIGVELMGKGGQLEKTAHELNWYLYNDIEQGMDRYPYPPILDDWAKFRNDCYHTQIQRHRDAIWCIMALCHDLGYSLAKLRGLNEKVKDVLKYFYIENFKQVGYSLDIEHQYLIEQFLELMAMDVRINPGKDYENVDKDKSNPSAKIISREAFNNDIKAAQKKVLEKLKNCPKKELDNFEFWTEFEEHFDAENGDNTERTKSIIDQAKKIEGQTLVKCYRDDSTYWRLCKALEKKEHGILSAYLLFKTLGTFADTSVRGAGEDWGLEDEEVIYNVIRGDILFAIAQHEFEYAHIDQLGSFAEILILCDELEEFTRLGRQLQSRKYHDTAAKTRVEISPSKNQRKESSQDVIGKWIDIKMTYIAKHNESDDFFKFFARKCEKLCKLYSLGQTHSEGDTLYNPIGSIIMAFEWHDPDKLNARKRKLTFEMKENPLHGKLPRAKHKYKKEDNCEYKKCPECAILEGGYEMECMDDKILIKTKCTKKITLRHWLGVKEDE